MRQNVLALLVGSTVLLAGCSQLLSLLAAPSPKTSDSPAASASGSTTSSPSPAPSASPSGSSFSDDSGSSSPKTGDATVTITGAPTGLLLGPATWTTTAAAGLFSNSVSLFTVGTAGDAKLKRSLLITIKAKVEAGKSYKVVEKDAASGEASVLYTEADETDESNPKSSLYGGKSGTVSVASVAGTGNPLVVRIGWSLEDCVLDGGPVSGATGSLTINLTSSMDLVGWN